MKKAIYILFLLAFLASCTNNEHLLKGVTPTTLPAPGALDIVPSAMLPVNTSAEANFYEDIPYGFDDRQRIDIMMPTSSEPTPLVIYIHGGGFTGGDKTKPYSKEAALIDNLLSQKVAFASINYRLLATDGSETQGVLKCLHDSRRAVQFIKYYANDFNIDKNRIVLMGGSAGAGTSLWIGVNDDMAETNPPYAFLKESTRVQGIVATNTQATYDVLDWHTSVFSEYEDEGMTQDVLLGLVGEETAIGFYGVSSTDELYDNPSVDSKRRRADMLRVMTNDDPEIYVTRASPAYVFPTNKGDVLHHPLHAKTILDKANETGIKCVAVIPQMGIDNSNGVENLVKV